MRKTDIRRVAVHELVVNDETLKKCIVDIDNGFITGYHQFSEEEPMVEWLGGVMELRYDEHYNILAYRNGKRVI